MKRIRAGVVLLSLLVTAGISQAGVQIQGAGATFPYPLYSKWFAEFQKGHPGVEINYQSIGSGGGINQLLKGTVDFGASDMPLKDDELAKKDQIQFPTVIGGVVPVVNIAGIKPGELKLTGDVLGDIYLGKIVKWNDAAIKALNPSLNLPDEQIAQVTRLPVDQIKALH